MAYGMIATPTGNWSAEDESMSASARIPQPELVAASPECRPE